jgi:hypothetical protein
MTYKIREKNDGFRHIHRFLGLQILVYLTSNREHMASNHQSLMNLKGPERKWLWFKAQSWNIPGQAEKNKETSTRTVCVPAEMQTRHLPSYKSKVTLSEPTCSQVETFISTKEKS